MLVHLEHVCLPEMWNLHKKQNFSQFISSFLFLLALHCALGIQKYIFWMIFFSPLLQVMLLKKLATYLCGGVIG